MDKREILSILLERNQGPGLVILVALHSIGKPLNRAELRKDVDRRLEEHGTSPALRSRHGIEKYTSKLYGAGLINIENFGTSHLYSISELGKEVLALARVK